MLIFWQLRGFQRQAYLICQRDVMSSETFFLEPVRRVEMLIHAMKAGGFKAQLGSQLLEADPPKRCRECFILRDPAAGNEKHILRRLVDTPANQDSPIRRVHDEVDRHQRSQSDHALEFFRLHPFPGFRL